MIILDWFMWWFDKMFGVSWLWVHFKGQFSASSVWGGFSVCWVYFRSRRVWVVLVYVVFEFITESVWVLFSASSNFIIDCVKLELIIIAVEIELLYLSFTLFLCQLMLSLLSFIMGELELFLVFFVSHMFESIKALVAFEIILVFLQLEFSLESDEFELNWLLIEDDKIASYSNLLF